ncbi:MAG: TerB family tellurite resistance protein [Saprospiraceae bacterium]|nr:TerB family tellurite resistance protein [Saprospiraceae bacterium]
MSELKWSFNEFLAFLLIYISHVDMDFADEEKTMIRKNLGEKTYDKMLTEFESMSDYKAYETILAYKGVYFPTVEQKAEIFEKIKDLCYADGDFNIMEKELLHFLERMM